MTSLVVLSFDDLVEKTRKEMMTQIEREQANLLVENFTGPIKFLPPALTSHTLIAHWFQVLVSMKRGFLRRLTISTDTEEQESCGGGVRQRS